MNIVFFGSDNFAVPSLKVLLRQAHKVSCVVTQPDRQKGRGLRLEPTAVKKAATFAGLKVFQPREVNEKEAIIFLKGLSPDLFVVISYGQILSSQVLAVPGIFAINAHASLLPKYRGAAPINWAIIKGEKTTGVTIIKMTRKMDAGPIIMQEGLDIKQDDSAISLEQALAEKASGLLLNSLEAIENKTYCLIPQDEAMVSFAQKLKKADGLINWENSAQGIYNLIRGCLGWPGAFTYYQERLLKIYKAKIIPQGPRPGLGAGRIINVSKQGIVVASGKDSLMIEELQIEAKRRMKAEEFIAGHKIQAGEKFGQTAKKFGKK